MDGTRWLHGYPQRGTDLYRQQSSMLITMLDGLHQGDVLWHYQAGTPPFACEYPLAVGPLQDAAIAVPAITEPVQLTLVRALDGGCHGLLDQGLTQGASGAGDHEATVAVLHQASPAFSLVWLAGGAVFFCTNAALLIDFHLAQVQIASQHLRDGRRMGRCPLEPSTDRLICMPRDLFGRS